MPEGHTLHALAARIDRAYAGRPVAVSSPQGRFAAEAEVLDGRPVVQSSAAGKHLFVGFGGGGHDHATDQPADPHLFLHVHLGLIGTFPVLPRADLPTAGRGEDPPVTGAVRLRLLNDTHVADLRGPQTCRLATDEDVAEVLSRLGPDPLRPDANPDLGWERIRRSRRSIADLLMDQAVIAGVGNVYRCEVLFRHRVDPFRPGERIRPGTWRLLWQDLVDLMPIGVAYGQILTMDDQLTLARAALSTPELAEFTASLTGERLGETFPRAFWVYRRTDEPCRLCGARIRTAVVAGRNLFWCGRCQRRG